MRHIQIYRNTKGDFTNFMGFVENTLETKSKKHLTKSLLPILTSSLPISAPMWTYYLSGDTYHSGKYYSSFLHFNGEL